MDDEPGLSGVASAIRTVGLAAGQHAIDAATRAPIAGRLALRDCTKHTAVLRGMVRTVSVRACDDRRSTLAQRIRRDGVSDALYRRHRVAALEIRFLRARSH